MKKKILVVDDKKELEELKLSLLEVKAYRDLQNESFCFNGIEEIVNDSKESEDAYYELLEDDLNEKVEELETKIRRRKK